MHRMIAVVLLALLATPVCALETPKNDDQKTLYAIGMLIARQLTVFNLTPDEVEIVKQGLTDSVAGKKTDIDIASYGQKVQDLARSRRKAQGEKLAVQNKGFLEGAAKEKGAVKTDSGLIFLSLKEGEGASPAATDTVKVNYRGTLPDGKEFDSSYKRGNPLEFRLDGVIKCWTEGLKMMKPGGKAKLVCPPNIAYGENGAGDLIPPGATLVFEVELLEVKPAVKPEVKSESKPVVKPEGKAGAKPEVKGKP